MKIELLKFEGSY